MKNKFLSRVYYQVYRVFTKYLDKILKRISQQNKEKKSIYLY